MEDVVNLEHSFYNCLINIEQCYQGNKKNVHSNNDLNQYAEELVDIFSKLPTDKLHHYCGEAKNILGKLQGTETIVDKLESICREK